MTEANFSRIESVLSRYEFSSMNYIDYSDVSDYQIVSENEDILLLHGFHREVGGYEYHWAANSSEALLASLPKDSPCFITFIPHDWVESFEKAGFAIRNAWHDYFMDSLDSIEDRKDMEFLDETECVAASEVTKACAGQSRGFTGQTPDWIREWLLHSEEESMETGIRNKAILVMRSEGNEIVGILCTCTYAHESEKGAISWIREVAVRPEYQGKGLGRRLILQALSYGRTFGAKRAFLAADECNTNAIHLYESIGFRAGSDKSQIDMILPVNNMSENIGKTVSRQGGMVVREGDACSYEIHRFLRFLIAKGLPVEQPVTVENGKEYYKFLEAEMVHPEKWSDAALYDIGRLLRSLHDAGREYTSDTREAFRPWYLRELGSEERIWCHGDLAPWNLLTKDGMPYHLVDWEFSGPLDPFVELARVCWLFAQLHDDDLAAKYDLPSPEKRAEQIRMICDGYGLGSEKRKQVISQIIEVIICETAHEAIDNGLSPDSEGKLWGFAWRTRSLYWVWRNRSILEKALL